MYGLIQFLFYFLLLGPAFCAKLECEGDQNVGYDVEVTSRAGRLLHRATKYHSAYSCQRACCLISDGDCTVAVWHQRKRVCSLYSCPTDLSCELTERKDYVAYTFDNSYSLGGDYDGTRDQINYKKGGLFPDDDSNMEVENEEQEDDENVRKKTADCRTERDCHSILVDGICHHGQCVCGFNQKRKGKRCYAPCSKDEFECSDLDSSSKSSPKYSRCIAIYNLCDGINNCADGSDEKDCSSMKETKPSKTHVGKHVTPTEPHSEMNNTLKSNQTEAGAKKPKKDAVASVSVGTLNSFLSTVASNETTIVITAVLFACSVAAIALILLVCRFCRAYRLSFRRRRLAEQLRRHELRDVGRRGVKKLFSANDDESDSLIPNDAAGNGMFLM